MKIFEFSYEVNYGNGVALIAANDKEEAVKIAKEELGIEWCYSKEREDMVFAGDCAGVILQCYYVE